MVETEIESHRKHWRIQEKLLFPGSEKLWSQQGTGYISTEQLQEEEVGGWGGGGYGMGTEGGCKGGVGHAGKFLGGIIKRGKLVSGAFWVSYHRKLPFPSPGVAPSLSRSGSRERK